MDVAVSLVHSLSLYDSIIPKLTDSKPTLTAAGQCPAAHCGQERSPQPGPAGVQATPW